MREYHVAIASLRIPVVVLLAMLVAACDGGRDPVMPPATGTVASVAVTSSVNSVPVGETVQLTATVRDAANQVLSGRTVTWISSDPALATVSGTGVVTGLYAGTVTIRATTEGVTGSVEITVTVPTKASVVSSHSVLDSTQAAFIRFAAQIGGDPARALGLVAEWAAADSRIARVDLIDSTYLQLQLKSGMVNIFRYQETDAQGLSVFRGGGRDGSSGIGGMSRFGSASMVISNKKVLICAAAYSEFYVGNQMEKIVDRFESAGLGFEVTLLKQEQCNYRVLPTFADYGFVILDTHGLPNGFLTGEKVLLDDAQRATEAAAKAAIDAQIAPGTYDKLVSGDLAIVREMGVLTGISDEWWTKSVKSHNELWVTSQFVRSLRMPNTIVFGNMCYSGFITHPTRKDPLLGGYIQPAFMSTGLIAYYSYSLLDGSSLKVTNDFAIRMEDSLSYALVVEGDSTGIAHLSSNLTVFLDRPFRDRYLRFTQYGALGYGYFRMAISPDTAIGEFGDPIAFTVDDFGTAPAHALYKWDFGDGTPVVSVTNDPSVVHTYQPKAGPSAPFNVSVTLYNNADPAHPAKIATVMSTARMLDPFVVQPAKVAADPGQNVTLTARPGGRAPVGARYRWNFGDGSPVVTVTSDSVVHHVFATVGSYRVTVDLIEPSQTQILATATAEVSTELLWTITSMTQPVTVGPAATGSGIHDYTLLMKQLDAIRAKPGDMTLIHAPTPFRSANPTMAWIAGTVFTGPNQGFSVALNLGSTAIPGDCLADNTLTNTGGGSTGAMVGHFVNNCQGPVTTGGQPTPWIAFAWTDFTATKSGTTLSGTLRFTIRDYVASAPFHLEDYRLLGERQVTATFTAERRVRAAASR